MWRSVRAILLLAAAYYLSGRLALLLAIPPGYSTAVWPAAGIAMAVLLRFGTRLWPGVVIGHFFVNLFIAFDSSSSQATLRSIALALIIACGGALQAAIGAELLRRVVGTPRFRDAREVITFFAMAGPLVCVVSATVGVSTLLAMHVVTPGDAATNWLTWWVGDSIGVLLFAPMVLIWTEPGRESSRRPLQITLALVAMFSAVTVLFVLASRYEKRQLRSVFSRQVDRMALEMGRNLDANLEVLRNVEGFYRSSSFVSREEFRSYTREIFAMHHGITSLSWTLRIPDEERAAFEAKVRADGVPDFSLREPRADGTLVPAATRPEHYVITYIEPFEENRRALGFDVAGDVARKTAIETSRDSARPVATPAVNLVQRRSAHDTGVVLYVPHYGGDAPPTVEGRRRELRGFISAALRVAPLIADSIQAVDREGIDTQVRDVTTGGEGKLLFSSGSAIDEPAAFIETDRIHFGGRTWQLAFRQPVSYLQKHRSWSSWAVLVGGLAFTSLMSAFLLIVTGRNEYIMGLVREQREALVESEERYRDLVENTTDLIQSVDGEGNFLYVNRAWRDTLGYTSEDMASLKLFDVIPGIEHRRGLLQRLAEGESLGRVTLNFLTRDGNLLTMEGGITAEVVDGRIVRGRSIFRDVTERNRADREIRDINRFLDAIIENLPSMLFVKEATELRFVRFNKAGSELLGIDGSEMIGKNDYDFFPAEEADFFTEKDREVLRSETAIDIAEEPIHTRHGQRWLHTRKIAIRDEAGVPRYLLGISEDITERKAMQAALDEKTDDLERSNRELEQFAYVASHDLQEPLRMVTSYLQLLARRYEGKLDQDADDFIGFAVDGAMRMKALIQDLLLWSRAGTRTLEKTRFPLKEAVDQSLKNLEVAIAESGARIECAELPEVSADRVQMEQLFQNLIGNAIKYRSEVPPQISVSAEQVDHEWHVSVSDNGIGFDPKFAERIFVIFQRLHTRQSFAGTGIGLAICKKIVERAGGRIEATSEPEKGSTFHFTLPIEGDAHE